MGPTGKHPSTVQQRTMKRVLGLILSAIFVFQLGVPVYAAETIQVSEEPSEAVETANIDGTNYTFTLDYSSNRRVITITNDKDDDLDVVTYDVEKSLLYLNGEIVGTVSSSGENRLIGYSISADDDWKLLSADTYTISWAAGATAAAVAAAIAVYLGTLGPAGVVAAMGTAALSAIAGASIGGELYLEVYMFHVPPTAPTYRYKWTFTPTTGETYGPYYYTYA